MQSVVVQSVSNEALVVHERLFGVLLGPLPDAVEIRPGQSQVRYENRPTEKFEHKKYFRKNENFENFEI